ncbi:endogenous retrovirus group 3 member 1 Env polyprotein [Ovis aries]|uniref:endogenous retrovirus group 3 member 1 Env polyprotein n=1 Tax=Ovis aries TaxID=9940 RepID=UPI00072F8354|nr:endogenous retrovirus group 3 member 1 Env polyprotein [Ovis aries]XP_042096425.1 endogenous retrovirus group 3 member 1 Env polyprotein [Ovis aries]XP_042096426.1 endogenous retrovirus group 3 member 1 Env polyprotein [Ovis aries]XP_042096427.1 endogenous retrovirus group 3 member 1 Env polyprotein [Ovis aries]
MAPCQVGTGCTTGLDAFCGSNTRGHFGYNLPKNNGFIKCTLMFSVIAFYILLSCSALKSKIDPSCTPCIHMTKSAQGVTWTLLYHTHFSCQGEVQGTCVHNKTTYFICQQNDKQSCFDPLPPISEDWLEVRHQKEGILINQTRIENEDLPVSVYFDACAAIGKNPKGVTNCGSLSWERTYTNNDKYMCQLASPRSSCYGDPWFYCPYWSCVTWATWEYKSKIARLQKGTASPSCKLGTCNPVNFTIFNPGDLKWKTGVKIGIYIHGTGADPGTVLEFRHISVLLQSSLHKVFYSFHEETESGTPYNSSQN